MLLQTCSTSSAFVSFVTPKAAPKFAPYLVFSGILCRR
jgi:hypothetical protein